MAFGFDRKDIRESPQWGFLIFGDGYSAQVVGMVPDKNEAGIHTWKFTLRPTDTLAKRYKINEDILDEETKTIEREYPMAMIVPLNLDPINQRYFCYLNFDGEETAASREMQGFNIRRQLEEYQRDMRSKEGENAYLREKLELAETNIRKYIKDNADTIMEAIGPTIKKSLMSDMDRGRSPASATTGGM